MSVPSVHTIDSEEESHCLIAKRLMLDIIPAFQLLHPLMVLVIQGITALKVQPLRCRYLALQAPSDQLKTEASQRIARSVLQEAIARLQDSACPSHAQLVTTVPWVLASQSLAPRVHTATPWG